MDEERENQVLRNYDLGSLSKPGNVLEENIMNHLDRESHWLCEKLLVMNRSLR